MARARKRERERKGKTDEQTGASEPSEGGAKEATQKEEMSALSRGTERAELNVN